MGRRKQNIITITAYKVTKLVASNRRPHRIQIGCNRTMSSTFHLLPGCVVMTIIIVIMLTLDQSTVQSFVLLSSRYNAQSGKIYKQSVDGNVLPLFARPERNLQKQRRKQKEQLQQQQPFNPVTDNDDDSIPANLKRKVQAKRPALGHIVPAATRTRGCKRLLRFIGKMVGSTRGSESFVLTTFFPFCTCDYPIVLFLLPIQFSRRIG
jgi:hypothetical protein